MNCQRCKTDEARYCVFTNIIKIQVCASCAWIALESGLAVDTLPKLRSIHLPSNVLDGDLPLNSAA